MPRTLGVAAVALVLLLASCGAREIAPPDADRGWSPSLVRGFGAADHSSLLYVHAEGGMLRLALGALGDSGGAQVLDLASGAGPVTEAEWIAGEGHEALLPSGPALPVPPTVTRARVTTGTLFVERRGDRRVRIAALGLRLAEGRKVDLAWREVELGTVPPGPAVR